MSDKNLVIPRSANEVDQNWILKLIVHICNLKSEHDIDKVLSFQSSDASRYEGVLGDLVSVFTTIHHWYLTYFKDHCRMYSISIFLFTISGRPRIFNFFCKVLPRARHRELILEGQVFQREIFFYRSVCRLSWQLSQSLVFHVFIYECHGTLSLLFRLNILGLLGTNR